MRQTLSQKGPVIFCLGILLVRKEGRQKGRGREDGMDAQHQRKQLQKCEVKARSPQDEDSEGTLAQSEHFICPHTQIHTDA